MNVDRYTKILLTIIAVALWIIALNPWIHQALAPFAKFDPSKCTGVNWSRDENCFKFVILSAISQIGNQISSIEDDLNIEIKSDISSIADGTCNNDRIC